MYIHTYGLRVAVTTGKGEAVNIESLKVFEAAAEGRAPCACFNVRRMSRAITQIYDEALKDSGVRGTQFSLLLGIAFKGQEGIGVIAEAMDMDRTTLSRNLKPLLAMKLVEERRAEDNRVRCLALTPKGESILEQCMPRWEQAQARVREGLTKAHFDALPEIANEIVALVREK